MIYQSNCETENNTDLKYEKKNTNNPNLFNELKSILKEKINEDNYEMIDLTIKEENKLILDPSISLNKLRLPLFSKSK